jgi:DNA-binding HxlR family transcriptional regulator
MKHTSERRSVCPVACTLDLIGDKWTLLVIRDLFAGKTSFKDLTDSPEHIATNILTDRLNRLCENGIVARAPTDAHAGRFEYTLTKTGKSLLPVLQSVADWGLKYLPGTAANVRVPRPT